MTRGDGFSYERAALSPAAREKVLAKLAAGARYDVVVIGAGVTGAGVALDAATRGLSVLLVEKHDLAFGTSRWSSKLAHGGLRYLASGNVGIARRSARERGILMEVTAPHLTRALGQVVPVMRSFSAANNVLPRLGFLAGDALRIAAGTRGTTLPRSRTISADRVAELCPAVDRGSVLFGYLNYDGQLRDDAALVTALARTAAGFGADVLTHCGCVGVDKQHVRLEGGLGVGAGNVVNATGVWAGDLDERVTVTPSRGTHLVVDASILGNPTGALTVPVPGAVNRFCFILPTQLGRCYIGLTDEPAPMEDEPTAPDSDVEWILDVVNQALKVKLTRADVLGTFAGLRPLVTLEGRADKETADLSREHVILRDGPLITVTGGKLTEYRLMAEQTVDLLTDDPCVTASTPLIGAPARPEDPAAAGEDRFAFAVSHEGARTVSDILDRRTRIGLVPSERAEAEPRAREALRAAGLEPRDQ
ncbi:glycerol-3-phosphate dehydrogenase/oxidase [Corynebacterium sp. UBA2622]|uniref:glycerol-3-phosphate dehydrogenase/oxidase n=1 Tax=Corynebacterium sp. UBA2622 TaxID=1946393 RepID=UPI0025C079DA|nr:glycerol-3-phosphate dehydrogenase/oxidase [Corynebacterium sp. UBA2622]